MGITAFLPPFRRVPVCPAPILPATIVKRPCGVGDSLGHRYGRLARSSLGIWTHDTVRRSRLYQPGGCGGIAPAEGRGCGFARDRLAVALPDRHHHGAVEQ